MISALDEKWRPLNCFFSRVGLGTYQHPCTKSKSHHIHEMSLRRVHFSLHIICVLTQPQIFANIQFSILHTSGCSHGAATQDTCTIQPPPQTMLLYSQHSVPWHSDKLASYILEEIFIPPHPHPPHPPCSSKSRTVYYKPVQTFRSFETAVHLIIGLAKSPFFVIIYACWFWQSSSCI